MSARFVILIALVLGCRANKAAPDAATETKAKLHRVAEVSTDRTPWELVQLHSGAKSEVAIHLMRSNEVLFVTSTSTGGLQTSGRFEVDRGVRSIVALAGHGDVSFVTASAGPKPRLCRWVRTSKSIERRECLALPSAPGRAVSGRFLNKDIASVVVWFPFEDGGLTRVYSLGPKGWSVRHQWSAAGLTALGTARWSDERDTLISVAAKKGRWMAHNFGAKPEVFATGVACLDAYAVDSNRHMGEPVLVVVCSSGEVQLTTDAIKTRSMRRLQALPSSYDVVLRDVDGDAALDLAVVGLRSHRLELWPRVLAGGPATPKRFKTGRGPGRLASVTASGSAQSGLLILAMEAHRLELWQP